MSISNLWSIRHTRHDLPVMAISYDSDTGETPIIVVNDSQPRGLVIKAVRALRAGARRTLPRPGTPAAGESPGKPSAGDATLGI